MQAHGQALMPPSVAADIIVYNGKQYSLYRQGSTTWTGAQAQCQTLLPGGILAAINSHEEFQDLVKQAGSKLDMSGATMLMGPGTQIMAHTV